MSSKAKAPSRPIVPVAKTGYKHAFPPDRLTKPNVAIVGFTDHRIRAFELGDDWEVWGINELHRHHNPELFHRWFEIHPITDFQPQNGQPGDLAHLQTLAKFPIPVYMQDHYQDIPASLPFPKEAVEKGLPRGDYQTSSISWEVALAILMGAKKIGIYGVDMANDTEYAEQRPCLEYWMGIAEGRGIEVDIPETSDLTHSVGQYAWGGGQVFHQKLRERLDWLHEEDNRRLQLLRNLDSEYNAKKEALLTERNQILGSIQDCSYWLRSWSVGGPGKPGAPTPDRSQDPRTGIGPAAGAPPPEGSFLGGPAVVGPVVPGGPAGIPVEAHDNDAGAPATAAAAGTPTGTVTEPQGGEGEKEDGVSTS